MKHLYLVRIKLYLVVCILTSLQFLSLNAQDLDSITLQLKYKHQFQFAGYYAAIEQGFFADEGIHVTLRENDFSNNYIDRVVAGEAEYGTSDGGLVISHLRGDPVVVVAQIYQHSPFALLSLKSSGVTTPYQLLGQKVMLDTLDAISLAMVEAILDKTVGPRKRSVEVVPHTHNPSDMIAGKALAVTTYTTNQPFYYAEQGVAITILDPRDYGIDFYGDNLFTSESEFRNHPYRVEKMRRATLRGWEYALKNREEIVDLILTKYDTQNKSRKHLLFEADKVAEMILDGLIPLGTINLSRYVKNAEYYAKVGAVKQTNVSSRFIGAKLLGVSFTEEERQWIKAHPKLRFGYIDWPPFEYHDEELGLQGLTKGYSDYIEEVTGIEMVGEYTSWENVMQGVKDSSYALGHVFYQTTNRLENYNFTRPYFFDTTVIIAKPENIYLGGLSAYSGMRVGAGKGYYKSEFIAANFPAIELVEFPTVEEGLAAVESGEIVAFVAAKAVADYIIHKNKYSNLQVGGYVQNLAITQLRFATPKKYETFRSILDKVLASMPPERVEDLYTTWGVRISTRETVLSPEEKKWIEEHPVIRCHVGNSLPYEYYKDSSQGISIEILNKIAKEFDLEIEYVHGRTFSEALAEFENDPPSFDMMSTVINTKSRRQKMLFTDPHQQTRWMLYRHSKSDIHFLHELNERTVAVQKGTMVSDKLLLESPQAKIVEFNSHEECLKALNRGEVDAYIGNLLMSSYIIEKLRLKNVVIATPTDWEPLAISMGVRDDYPLLISILNKGLASISVEEKNILSLKYFSTIQKDGISRHVLLAFLVTSVIAIVVLLWNFTLRRKVRAGTKQLQQYNEQLEITVEERTKNLNEAQRIALVGNLEVDFQTNEVHWSDEMYRILGYSPDVEASFQSYIACIHPDDKEEVLATIAQARKNGGCIQIKHRILVDGEVKHVTFSNEYSTNKQGEVVALIATIQDVTEQRQFEMALVEAKERAEAANQAKSSFLANMSHEIRTPMNAIIGFSHILSTKISDPKLSHYLTTIQASSKTLLSLINDILDLSKIEAGKIKIHNHEMSLSDFMTGIDTLFRAKAELSNIDFEIDADSVKSKVIMLDETRLRQIIVNLVDNALKFTSKGSVDVICSFEEENSECGTLEIKVADTGTGIALSKQKEIFHAFTQEDESTTRNYGGTGLGLCISKRLAELMGGTLTVESDGKSGTTFTLIIPAIAIVCVGNDDAAEDLDIDNVQFTPFDVLVVDDVVSNRELLCEYLEPLGGRVHFAKSGFEAVEKAENIIPKIIFMDLRMPGMDGQTAAAVLIESEKTAHVPIVACTAAAFKSTEKEILAEGFVGYIRKPFLEDDVVKILRKFLPTT